MSALDMVLQRQVPARTTAKTGEDSTGADAAGGSRNDAFSAALSNEKRSAAAERDKVESKNEVDDGADATETSDQDLVNPGQSDEILNLLSGLKSSAAYADDIALGKAVLLEDEASAAAAALDADEEAEAANTDKLAINTTSTNKPELTGPGVETEARSKVAGKNGIANGMRTDANSGSGDVVQPVADAKTVAGANAAEEQIPADIKSSASLASAAVTASGMAGQGAQPPAKTPAADTAQGRQKDSSAINEVMRALGMDGDRQPGEAENAKLQNRDRNAGKQSGAADQRLEELTGKKDGKVEVIESRRFMPVQNMSANSQMLTRSLADAGSAALSAQRSAPAQPVATTGLQQSGQMLHTLKLQLNPASLGSVTAIMKLSGDDLSVEIKVHTAEAYRQIKEDNQSILKALRGQGFGVEQITVQHVTTPDRSSGQSAQQGFQGNQQGTGSGDAQSFGKESGRNSAGQQGAGSQGGQSHEQGSYTGPGAGRTDGVYL